MGIRLVLLGPPGAGKGTQAQFLTARLGIPKISTGDMLRAAGDQGTKVGLEAKQYIDHGRLVPDDLIIRLVEERLLKPDVAKGYLLDGFPRTVPQAESLQGWLGGRGEAIQAAVDLKVPDEEIVERISNRRVCAACQETYHLTMKPARVREVCNLCGAKLVQREDDRAELVRERLHIYHERTEPVLGYYRNHGMLIEINGLQPVADVTEAIVSALAQRNGRHRDGQ
jgi:adenylate kinase